MAEGPTWILDLSAGWLMVLDETLESHAITSGYMFRLRDYDLLYAL